jgi:hypothetical protein
MVISSGRIVAQDQHTVTLAKMRRDAALCWLFELLRPWLLFLIFVINQLGIIDPLALDFRVTLFLCTLVPVRILVEKNHGLEAHALAMESSICNIVVARSVVHHLVDATFGLVGEQNFFDSSLRLSNLLGITDRDALVLDLHGCHHMLLLNFDKGTVVGYDALTRLIRVAQEVLRYLHVPYRGVTLLGL